MVKQEIVSPDGDHFTHNDFPFYWLAQVNSRYAMAMERILKRIDLDIPQWRLLNLVKQNESISVSDLAYHAIFKLSTTTRIIHRMRSGGLVETSQSTSDKRITMVSITPAGISKYHEMHKLTADLFERSFDGITETQFRRLNETLINIFNNLPKHM